MVLSIHPPVALLEWVVVFSGQQPGFAFSHFTAVGFLRKYHLSFRSSPGALSIVLAELERQTLC